MSVATGTKLYPHRQEVLVLDWRQGREFQIWLGCGHPGGLAKAGTSLRRRRCHSCGGLKEVSHVAVVR
jgi:hypothetical protein